MEISTSDWSRSQAIFTFSATPLSTAFFQKTRMSSKLICATDVAIETITEGGL